MNKICDNCETAIHCEKYGCIPERIGKPAQQGPVAKIEIARCKFTGELESWKFAERPRNAPAGTYYVYTSPQPAQQEPVAKYIGEGSEGSLVQLYEDVKKGTDFYTSPPAQRTPFAYVWTNSKGQAAYGPVPHDIYPSEPLYKAPQPEQRKPLDAGEISRLWKQHTNEDGPHHNPYDDDGLGFARAIEAAHNIKENT